MRWITRLINGNRVGRHVRDQARRYRITFSVIEGNVLNTQNTMTLLIAGFGHDKAYLLDRIFGNDYTEKCTRTMWLPAFHRYISRYRPDLLIAINPEGGIRHYLNRRNTFDIPTWVRGEIDFKIVAKLQKKSKNVKHDLHRIRKNGLDYTVTREPELFDDFYHNMHVPHINKTFGDSALLVEYQEMVDKISTADLLLVKKDGDFIAGVVILYEKGGARSWFSGIKDGNREYLRLGALTALYYFSNVYLKETGFDRIHAGSSRAFLNDGVLQYKKKWGMRLIGARQGNFAVHALKKSKACISFFTNNPFIQLRDNEFTGMYFLDSDKTVSEEKIREIHKLCYFPGMKQLNIYQLGETQHDMQIPTDLQGTVTACSASTLL